MTWFAFQGLNNGKAVNLAGTQEKQAVVEGFHGYSTEQVAEANPNSVNFLTRTFADAWIADYNAAVKEQAQPGGKNATITNPTTAVNAGVTGVESEFGSLTGLDKIGAVLASFYHEITNGKMWRSLGWLIFGLLLVYVGVRSWISGGVGAAIQNTGSGTVSTITKFIK